MNWNTIFLIACSIGAVQSFFIGGYFVSLRKGKRISNLLLGCLFLSVAVRVAKSTLWLYYLDISNFIINIGFGAHLAIVPFLLFYLLSFKPAFNWRWHYNLHFIPAVAVFTLSLVLNDANFWYIGGYSALLYHSVIYLIAVLFYMVKYFKEDQIPHRAVTWLKTLFISITLLHMAYFMNYEMGLTRYITGPVIYSGIIYFLTYYVLRNYSFFSEIEKPKYRNIRLSDDDVSGYTAKVKNAIEGERLFLSPEFTLSQLSEKTGIAKHLLSNLFNVHLKISFTDYTNQYRIDKAKELLKDEAYDNLKISAIAYECGFNTLSAFNAAFRKNTNVTPSEFKRRLSANV